MEQGFWKRSLSKLKNFFRFLFHAYSVEQFSVVHAKSNLLEIINLAPGEGLYATSQGKLRRLQTPFQRSLFKIGNMFIFGAYQYRVERSVYFTFMSHCIEIYNPMNRSILLQFLERKADLLERALNHVKIINGKRWPYGSIRLNIDLFKRSSLLQERIIEKMQRCVRYQREPEIVKEAKEALTMGLHPILVIQGLSGTYWMRGKGRETLGLFKPFDEEAFAPNNPCGIVMQGALGQRRMRPGIRVGETTLREVAAYVVDEFFGFGIVPKTYYATFSHHVFYHAQTQAQLERLSLTRAPKKKLGSFQEYIEGFHTLGDIEKEEWAKVPEVEYQLLVLLDVILGNMDRNLGNILVGDEKIAAIDHGLTLPDINLGLSTWYWKGLEQGKKPLMPALLKLLREFPFEKLSNKLQKWCAIDLEALQRMKERVVLFREGITALHTPFEMYGLFTDENLAALVDYDETLDVKAREVVEKFRKEKENKKNGE